MDRTWNGLVHPVLTRTAKERSCTVETLHLFKRGLIQNAWDTMPGIHLQKNTILCQCLNGKKMSWKEGIKNISKAILKCMTGNQSMKNCRTNGHETDKLRKNIHRYHYDGAGFAWCEMRAMVWKMRMQCAVRYGPLHRASLRRGLVRGVAWGGGSGPQSGADAADCRLHAGRARGTGLCPESVAARHRRDQPAMHAAYGR